MVFCQALQMQWKIHCRRAPYMILRFLLAMTNLFLQVRKGNYRRAEAKIISLYDCEVSNTATPPG